MVVFDIVEVGMVEVEMVEFGLVVVGLMVVMKVVVVLGFKVEVDKLMNDHVRFSTYHQQDFNHQA